MSSPVVWLEDVVDDGRDACENDRQAGHACFALRRFPSRAADANPTRTRLSIAGISMPSMKDSDPARIGRRPERRRETTGG